MIIPLDSEDTIEYLDHFYYDTHIRNGPNTSFPEALSPVTTNGWAAALSNGANPKPSVTTLLYLN